jgi:simple sugar transport system permease protein
LTLLVVTSICFMLASSAFLSAGNISNMWAFIPELGLMALAMTMLLTAGEFDLSVGAVFAFGPLLTFTLVTDGGVPFVVAIVLGLLACAAIGVVNGFLVTKVGISSFLVTLGTMLTIRGLALYMSDGFPQNNPISSGAIHTFLVGQIKIGSFTIYASVFWFLGLAALLHFILNETRFGNSIMATGGNRKSAAARGIPTDWVKIRLFIFAGVVAGVAGLIDSLRIGSASPIAGQGYELEVIAMAVVGGTSLFGGRGTVIGTVIGTVLLRSIRNGIVIVGFAGLAYDMFVGLIILIAMSVQALLQRQGGR